MSGQNQVVSVIVPAWNCADTIGRAVSSALAQAEVGEIIVVDDASSDGTAEVARSAEDGTGRIKILQKQTNRGPAAARNSAIEQSSAPFIAVLDADDYFAPNRFASLFQIPDWDLIADNIAFIPETHLSAIQMPSAGNAEPITIDLETFIVENISRKGRPRGELGFAKAVIRRDFLDKHGLRYDESLRLGEDYGLYAECLAAGARFLRSGACGYVAIKRPNSLSRSHRTADLIALLRFDEKLASEPGLSKRERRAVLRHRHHVMAKVHHREVLDSRRDGIAAALKVALARPALMPQLALAVARDKLSKGDGRESEVRYLF